MPELPELEVVCEVLNRRLATHVIERVSVDPKGGPIVLRDLTGAGVASSLEGRRYEVIYRRGKFLIFDFSPPGPLLAINPKLTGRLQLTERGGKKAGPVHLTLHMPEPAEELRYVDRKRMGQIYLTDDLAQVHGFADMGPEPLNVTLEEFAEHLKAFRGEIKGVLVRGSLVAGIGNAYADEILWRARIHPFRKRTTLSDEEVEQLHSAMQASLHEATAKVREEMGDDIHLKPRDFFSVHMQSGEACSRCGTSISAITANQRITNFCRTCQPGGLFRGMGSARG